MQDYIERIAFLLSKVMNKEELTPEEKKEIDDWVVRSPQNQLLWDDVVTGKSIRDELKAFMDYDDGSGRQKLSDKMGEKITARSIFLGTQHRWIYAAAGFLVFVFAVLYFWSVFQARLHQNEVATKQATGIKDLPPGGDIATLTLADGSTIALNNVQDGVLAQEGLTRIEKTGGQIVYKDSIATARADERYNKVSTPRGGQYSIILPDGTIVWLNAASSLRFPASFSNVDRRVELEGEAFFEVRAASKEGSKIPFKVSVGDMTVAVMGTQFNLNAYADESSITTTLVEGSVKIIKGSNSVLLKPDQQARVTQAGQINVINTDVQQVTAWKNGIFQLTGADISTIMRQVERWYNVEVEYQGSIPSARISGEIPRNMNLSEILKVLELSGVKSRLDGKKVIVLP